MGQRVMMISIHQQHQNNVNLQYYDMDLLIICMITGSNRDDDNVINQHNRYDNEIK